jgi:hypothetical protein
VLGEATYEKNNEIRSLAIQEFFYGDWRVHIDKMERSFNERYVYTPEQLRSECKSLEKKLLNFEQLSTPKKTPTKNGRPK